MVDSWDVWPPSPPSSFLLSFLFLSFLSLFLLLTPDILFSLPFLRSFLSFPSFPAGMYGHCPLLINPSFPLLSPLPLLSSPSSFASHFHFSSSSVSAKMCGRCTFFTFHFFILSPLSPLGLFDLPVSYFDSWPSSPSCSFFSSPPLLHHLPSSQRFLNWLTLLLSPHSFP